MTRFWCNKCLAGLVVVIARRWPNREYFVSPCEHHKNSKCQPAPALREAEIRERYASGSGHFIGWGECSGCNETVDKDQKYCHNCGAKFKSK